MSVSLVAVADMPGMRLAAHTDMLLVHPQLFSVAVSSFVVVLAHDHSVGCLTAGEALAPHVERRPTLMSH